MMMERVVLSLLLLLSPHQAMLPLAQGASSPIVPIVGTGKAVSVTETNCFNFTSEADNYTRSVCAAGSVTTPPIGIAFSNGTTEVGSGDITVDTLFTEDLEGVAVRVSWNNNSDCMVDFINFNTTCRSCSKCDGGNGDIYSTPISADCTNLQYGRNITCEKAYPFFPWEYSVPAVSGVGGAIILVFNITCYNLTTSQDNEVRSVCGTVQGGDVSTTYLNGTRIGTYDVTTYFAGQFDGLAAMITYDMSTKANSPCKVDIMYNNITTTCTSCTKCDDSNDPFTATFSADCQNVKNGREIKCEKAIPFFPLQLDVIESGANVETPSAPEPPSRSPSPIVNNVVEGGIGMMGDGAMKMMMKKKQKMKKSMIKAPSYAGGTMMMVKVGNGQDMYH